MPTIDVSQFPLHDYAHAHYGLPVFALRNWTGMSFGVALFGVMLQEQTIAPGQQICLIIDGKEYLSQIINITRTPIGEVVISTSLLPIVGAVPSCLCLGEPFQANYILAGGLVASGIYIVNAAKGNAHR